jgi:hypothetical protein
MKKFYPTGFDLAGQNTIQKRAGEKKLLPPDI